MERDPQHLNYYERLGVPKHAGPDEITAAYKTLRRQFHPDTKPAPYRAYFDHMMKGINEAHDVLKDPVKRQRYDSGLSNERRTSHREQATYRRRGDNTAGDARTRNHSRRTDERASRNQYSFYGEVPSSDDYKALVDAYENGVEGLKNLNARFQGHFYELLAMYERIKESFTSHLQSASDQGHRAALEKAYEDNKKKLFQLEQQMKSDFSADLRAYEVEVFGELLAAIDYVEHYLPGLPRRRRIRLGSNHDELTEEASSLLAWRVVR